MASTIKVDNVQNQPGTNIINKCGATITVGAACNSVAVTGNVVKSNALQASDAGNIISQSGTDITLGASGDTIALACGASQTGFGRTGTVDWQTGSIKTATFTAATGEGYFCNTTGGAFELDLPAGAAGSIVSIQDYNNTFDTYALTVDPDGSEKINGGQAGEPVILDTEAQGVTFVYIDSTVGWRSVQDNLYAAAGSSFVTATGGTPSSGIACGDYKIHIFNGPGTFCVSAIAVCSACNAADYLVAAGGGGAGYCRSGGGGAGGTRFWANPVSSPTPGAPGVPLNGHPSGTAITLAVSPYSITVGGGGGGAATSPVVGCNGSNSIFSTITSTGGGGGSSDIYGLSNAANTGGSGGGGANDGAGAAGNTPSSSPAQGTAGGDSVGGCAGGGGGGSLVAAANAPAPNNASPGGDGLGLGNSIFGSTGVVCGSYRYYGGGGGGGGGPDSGCHGGGKGGGGEGKGSPGGAGDNGTVNTAGGGGGASTCSAGGTGGSGVVIIKYKFQ